jgi:hypothetical protein
MSNEANETQIDSLLSIKHPVHPNTKIDVDQITFILFN